MLVSLCAETMKPVSIYYIREENATRDPIQVALQKREREVGLAEAALQVSYTEEVYMA